MTTRRPTIAILSTSPALASILGAILRRDRAWRVREFCDARALCAYMRIAPVEILVCDFELEATSAPETVSQLRADPLALSPDVQVIALTRRIDEAMRKQCVVAGIDEVIVKPMSPLYLEERIQTRLAQGADHHISTASGYRGPERRERIAMDDTRIVPVERRGENVVSFLAHKAMHGHRDDPNLPR